MYLQVTSSKTANTEARNRCRPTMAYALACMKSVKSGVSEYSTQRWRYVSRNEHRICCCLSCSHLMRHLPYVQAVCILNTYAPGLRIAERPPKKTKKHVDIETYLQ